MKKIKDDAIDEAVKAAVIPLYADIEALSVKVEDQENEINLIKHRCFTEKLVVGGGALAVGCILGFVIGSLSTN